MSRKRRIMAGLALPLLLGFGPTGALAEEPAQGILAASFGSDLSGIRSMSDEELGEARGGYGGVFFSIFGYGDISTLGGQLPDGVTVSSLSPDQVSLSLGLAQLPNTGGFLQFASVHGNNNVVNNTLILNVYFLDGGVADTSAITNGSALGF